MSDGMHISTALETLGLTNSATEEDVKRTYKELARIWHPDRFQNDERLGARTEAQIKVINEARAVALAYLNKYGHFQHVGRDKSSGTRRQATNEYSYEKHQAKTNQNQAPPGEKPPEREEKQTPPRQDQEREEQPKSPPKAKTRKKRKKAPKAKSKAKKQSQTYYEPGFQMDQGTLVIIFIILVLVSFLFMLGYSILNPPEEKLERLTKKIVLTDEKSDLRKKWEAKRAKESLEAAAAVIPEPVIIDTFFTLGSDKDWVSEVQGPPHQIKGGNWVYGYSLVQFGDGKVVGWKSARFNPLKIGMLLDSVWLFDNDSFRVGSFVEEVIALQGTPNVIDGGHWEYGDASVEFEADTVVTWVQDNDSTLFAGLPTPSVKDTLTLDSLRVDSLEIDSLD